MARALEDAQCQHPERQEETPLPPPCLRALSDTLGKQLAIKRAQRFRAQRSASQARVGGSGRRMDAVGPGRGGSQQSRNKTHTIPAFLWLSACPGSQTIEAPREGDNGTVARQRAGEAEQAAVAGDAAIVAGLRGGGCVDGGGEAGLAHTGQPVQVGREPC